MLSCREITELASDYLEGELPLGKRLFIRVHLWMCTHCQTYLAQLRKVIELLRRVPKEPPKEELLEILLPEFRRKHRGQA